MVEAILDGLYTETIDLEKARIGFAGFEKDIGRYVDEIGKKHGFVPYFRGMENLVSFRDLGELDYVDQEVEDDFADVKEAVTKYLAKEFGVVPYVKDLSVRVARLPTYTWTFLNEDGKIVERPVGKVFGLYDPTTREMVIDPVLLRNSPERRWLEKYFQIPTRKRVMGEELLHHVQDVTKVIDYNERKFDRHTARNRIEGAAAEEADRLFGRTGLYQEEKEDYRRGGRNFFEGGIPEVVVNGVRAPLYGYN